MSYPPRDLPGMPVGPSGPGGPGGPPPAGPTPPPRRPGWVLPTVLAVLVVATVVAGAVLVSSGDDDDGEPAGSSDSAETTEAEGGRSSEAATATLTGTWEGSYTCAQGLTDVTFTIYDSGEGGVEAFWEFNASQENPGVPSGGHRMEGALEDGMLSLAGTEWMDPKPADYSQVSLEAEVSDPAADSLSGTITDPSGCEDFEVERTSSDAWFIGTWEGGYDCGQGPTGLTLTLEDAGEGVIAATYEFYEVESNPGVPSGSYTLTGEYADWTLSLISEEWIDQPEGYVMVDISSNPEVITPPDTLAGHVDDPSCQMFLLDKVS